MVIDHQLRAWMALIFYETTLRYTLTLILKDKPTLLVG